MRVVVCCLLVVRCAWLFALCFLAAYDSLCVVGLLLLLFSVCWLACSVCCQLSVVSCHLYDIHVLLIVLFIVCILLMVLFLGSCIPFVVCC